MAPWGGQYENEFEKQVYQAINIFRANPPRWAPIIQETYAKNKLLDTKSQKDLITAVKAMEKMTMIRFDDALNTAVRSNNVAVTTEDIKEPKEGGNIDVLTKNDSSIKVENCQEVTMIEYLGAAAEEFITLMMIKCWENPKAVKEETVVVEKKEDLLPVVESDKPKVEEKPAASKETKAVDPKLYAKNCPLFDPLVAKMGISNRGHKYKKNVIQMLFMVEQVNSME